MPGSFGSLHLRGGKKEKEEKTEKKKKKKSSGEDDGGDGEGVAAGKVLKRGRKDKTESRREDRESSPRKETRSMSPQSVAEHLTQRREQRSTSPTDSKAAEKKSRKRGDSGKDRWSKEKKDVVKEKKDGKPANTTAISSYRISTATAKALEKQGITSLFPIQVLLHPVWGALSLLLFFITLEPSVE